MNRWRYFYQGENIGNVQFTDDISLTKQELQYIERFLKAWCNPVTSLTEHLARLDRLELLKKKRAVQSRRFDFEA